MPRTAFKMITSGPGTNGSPLSQAGVYQSAVPEPQMRGKKSLCCPTIVALAVEVWRQEAHVFGWYQPNPN